jgi:hypothetical protein
VIGLNSGTYDWALVVIADGKAAISRTDIDEEVQRCQRYYEKSFPLEVAPAQNAGLAGAHISPQCVLESLATTLGHVPFKQSKPRIPALVTYNPLAASAQPRNVTTSTNYTAVATTAASQDGFGVTATSPASSTAGQTAAFHWSADASLNPVWNGIDPPVLPTLTLTGTYMDATVGTPYSSDLTIAGGNGVYSLTGGTGVSSGSIPAGLSLSIVGRLLRLSSTPTGTAGTDTFTASVNSGDGQTATSPQSVVVSTMIAVTLNPADKDPAMTLNTSKLIVTRTGATAQGFVRTTSGLTTGKWFWCVRMTSSMVNDRQIAAIIDGASSNTSSISVHPLGYSYDGINGVVYNTGSAIDNLGTFDVGDWIMMAFNASIGHLWFGKNGVWLNSLGNPTDPATDLRPVVSSIPAGTYFPAIDIYDNGGAAQIALSAADQPYAAPSGFSPVST